MSARSNSLEDVLEAVKEYLTVGKSDRKRDADGRLLHQEDRPVSAADILSELGADVNATNDRGESLLTIALINNESADVIRELLAAGASVTRDTHGFTPLHYSLLYNSNPDVEILRLLLDYNADVNAKSEQLETPLHCIMLHEECHHEVVELLLKSGADASAKDIEHRTPLHQLLHNSQPNYETVRLLVEYKADVNAKDEDRRTPLHYHCVATSSSTRPEILQLLLKNGADVKAKDIFGLRPFDIVLFSGNVVYTNIMINFRIINEYDGDMTKVSDMKASANAEVEAYINQCVDEVDQMKRHRVNDEFSLYDWYRFVNRRLIPKPLYSKEMFTEDEICKQYPVYGNTLWTVMRECLDRADLFNQLEELQSTGVCSKLGSHCWRKIAEYIPNPDLLNFVHAIKQPVVV